MFGYSKLELDVNAKTPGWIVNSGILNENFGWMPVVTFKNRIVRRAKFQDNKWTLSNNVHAYPDFMIFPKRSFSDFKYYEEMANKGYNNIDILNKKIVSTRLYLEVFGDYFHSGERIQGITKEEHQREVELAYESAGYSVLILWESEINNNWDDICLPKIYDFLKKSGEEFDGWDINKMIYNKDMVLSLKDSLYWRNLGLEQQDMVVSDLIKNYSVTGFPFPGRSHVRYERRRFEKWVTGNHRRETRFGNNIPKFYTKSILDAKVNKSRSLREIWDDKILMGKCIRWQLSNETGKHNANRFLNAMCNSIGFRVVSGISPSKVIRIIDSHVIKGGVFFDPCAGWGGRMLGVCSLGMKYIGIDANKALVDELNKMKDDLKLDAEIYYGDSSYPETVKKALKGRRIDLCFTSPPYYDKEIYSDDEFQSVKKRDYNEWESNFLIPMIENVSAHLKGKFILNLPEHFNSLSLSKYGLEEKLIDMRHNNGIIKEKLLFISKNRGDKITCQICGKQKSKLGIHLKKVHRIDIEDYKKIYGDHVVSDSLSLEISNKLRERTGMNYNRRLAYLLPNGRIVRRKEVWLKEWGNNPPEDTIIKGEEYTKYKKGIDDNRVENIDYVCCAICGYKSSNISRHIRREHKIEPEQYSLLYKREVYGKKFKDNRFNPWSGGERDSNRKRKKIIKHTFIKEELEKLYSKDLLTDKQISEIYNMTPEGILYQRKRFGIKTMTPRERKSIIGDKVGFNQ